MQIPWRIGCFLLIASLGQLPRGASQGDAAKDRFPAQDHIEWVKGVLDRMGTVKPGMTRAEVLQVFHLDGGGQEVRFGGRFDANDCPYFKVDVSFRQGPSTASGLAMTAVMTTLKKALPAEALATSAFSVQPEMERPNGVPRVKDYLARNQIQARVDDLEKLSDVLDASVASGATSVAGLRFDVKARAQWEREALRLAVQDATERAQAIAAGAGRTLGPVLRIQEERNSNVMIDGISSLDSLNQPMTTPVTRPIVVQRPRPRLTR
jgi:Protein of unknown function (DUF541)